MIELMHYDGHPLSAWVYIVAFRVLGIEPLAWHLFSLFFRWLAAVAAWKLMHQIWPGYLKQTLTAAIFFLIHPAFILQPQAICYSEVWISYAVLLWSFYYSGRGIQEHKYRYHIIGFSFKFLHIFTSAYVTGLEFVRPFLIWHQIPENYAGNVYKKILYTFKLWLPYLFINLAYVVWRVFFYSSPVDNRAEPVMIAALLDEPIQSIQVMLGSLFPDAILILITSWYAILTPYLFKYSNLVNGLLLVVLLLSGLLMWFVIQRISLNLKQDSRTFPSNLLIISSLFLLFGLAPYYAIGYFMHDKMPPWNSRVALGSLLGAGMLASYLFYAIISGTRRQNIVLAVLVALLIGYQVRNANEFRLSWNKQVNLYQQLSWRIPDLEENVAILSEQEILFFMGDYPTSFAINVLYQKDIAPNQRQIPYWFFPVSSSFWGKESDLQSGILLTDAQHSFSFSSPSTRSILIRFEPDTYECLRVIRPQDAYSQSINASERQLATISDLGLITETPRNSLLQQQALSDAPSTWCYYYQKADLARQFLNWQEVVTIWQSAQKHDKRPAHGFEYIPFIEGYAQTGDWKTARQLTDSANRISRRMYHSLCPVWQELYLTTPESPSKQDEYKEVIDFLGCVISTPESP